ncbi:MAG: lactate utilization protein C [Gammaproteobacteria bacterium]|nr:lactate utilization protein C [Gammaproteobacteria bacterium]MBU1602952.1 lactate utilization protein C [Gammaproteobacteria bacterium]MBU2434804.1 lactate utilization protein C [Gammaproteobacteria bacterium]MBU2448833.1 lactate utilization protein C [Gammaproteobacteria bacterium]
MSARDDILGRVRRGVGKDDFAGRRAAAVASLTTAERGPQPVIGADLVGRFRAKAEYLSSTVAAVTTPAEVPAAVAAYLAANGLAGEAVATADVGGLDWSGSGLTVAARPAVDADKTGISGCFCAIAETGTLMLLSGPDSPATVSLLPETHIALVEVSRIVATMEDAFALLRAERGSLPRAVNFISGPSRTGDIEQTIVLGAHGPCRVHLILIGRA